MKLANKIPVEQLDEERLTNIERRIVIGVSECTPEHVPRRGFVFAAGGMLAVATAALIGWKLHTVTVVEQVAITPQHFAVGDGRDGRDGRDGAKVSIDGATLAGTASYDVTRTPTRIEIQMQRGSLELAVIHDPHRSLVIHAGDTEIEDIGTKFHVDFDGASTIAVRVAEGEVQVTRRGRVARVSAGNAWTTETGTVALAVLDAPKVIAAADPVAVPAVTHVSVVVRQPPIHHVEAVVPPHVPEPRVVTTIDPYLELRTAIRSVPLELAPAIDGHSDAATEIAKLKKIAYSPTTLGPEASAATYQIAVLLYRPLGQDSEALNTLEMYRRRFAGGKELHAAQWLRVRIECSHTVDEACRRAAYSYQHEVTSGRASDIAIRITNTQ